MYLFVYFMSVGGHTQVHVCRAEDNFGDLLFFFHPVGPEMESRWSDLANLPSLQSSLTGAQGYSKCELMG